MRRHPQNPILTRQHIISRHPALQDVSSVFNPGGIMHDGEFLLLLRVQNRARETLFVTATSVNGVDFRVTEEPIPIMHLERCPYTIYHIYDARITRAWQGSGYHILAAMDTDKGCFLGYFFTEDFGKLDFKGIASQPDVRNGVLLAGTPYRFERPNKHQMADGVKTGALIVCSESEDFLNWRYVADVFDGRPHFWDELIGSGPAPLLCPEGWLHIYHGVATHFGSANIYQVGISLQDTDKPWLVLARGRYNILEPRELYELTGQVPNVVFPTAAIPLSDAAVLDYDTEIYVYYGAADTSIGLAITTVKELLAHAFA